MTRLTRRKCDPVDPDDPTRFQRWPIMFKMQLCLHVPFINYILPNNILHKSTPLSNVHTLVQHYNYVAHVLVHVGGIAARDM